MLSRLFVGNAAMRKLSHPKKKKYAVQSLNILFRSRGVWKEFSASRTHCGQRLSWQRLLLILTEEGPRRFYDRQILVKYSALEADCICGNTPPRNRQTRIYVSSEEGTPGVSWRRHCHLLATISVGVLLAKESILTSRVTRLVSGATGPLVFVIEHRDLHRVGFQMAGQKQRNSSGNPVLIYLFQ